MQHLLYLAFPVLLSDPLCPLSYLISSQLLAFVTQLAFPFDFLVSVSCLGRGWSSFSFQPWMLLSVPPSLFLFFSDASLPFNQTVLSCLAWVPTLETTETTENRPVPAVLPGEIWLE